MGWLHPLLGDTAPRADCVWLVSVPLLGPWGASLLSPELGAGSSRSIWPCCRKRAGAAPAQRAPSCSRVGFSSATYPPAQLATGSAWRPQRMADPQREKCETVPELPALSHDPGRDYQLLLPGHSQYPCLDSSQSCSNMFSCSPGPAAQLLVIPVFANPAGSLKGPHCQHRGVDLEQ